MANTPLLDRKATSFVLWRLDHPTPPPVLIIGEVQAGAPIRLTNLPPQPFPLTLASGFTDLWELPVASCRLPDGRPYFVDGTTYHYWFEVTVAGGERRRITDPTAFMVDWRLLDPKSGAPASVIRFANGGLEMADAGGEIGNFHGEPPLNTLPTNNRLVIYELPTAWTVTSNVGSRDIGVGTFADVTALVDAKTVPFANFDRVDLALLGEHYLGRSPELC